MLKLDYRALESFISSQRLQRYLEQAQGNAHEATVHYLYNLETSQNLYGLLHWLEIGLRNRINKALSGYAAPTWFNTASLSLAPIEEQQLSKAIDGLIRERKPLDNGGIVAALHFGFWINLFNSPYEELWRRCLRQVFANHPTVLTRKAIRIELGHVHRIRNRVAHYEPINPKEAKEAAQRIILLIQWMDAEQLAQQLQHDIQQLP